MGARPVTWTFTKSPLSDAPAAVHAGYPDDRWIFVGWSEDDERSETGPVKREETQLAKTGIPYAYTLEGDVEDVSRQHIANRATVTVHPAPWYIGVRKPPYFIDQK